MSNDRKSDAIRRLAQQWTLQAPNFEIIDDSEKYPWFTQEIQRSFRTEDERGNLILPNLREYNETVAIYSDYGGESRDSRYFTYSFLVCAWNQSDPFSERMSDIRTQFGLDEPFKEIAFKDFGYGPLQRALSSYLAALSNLVNGLLLTVVVDKRLWSMFGESGNHSRGYVADILEEEGFGKWKPKVAEKMVTVLHCAAYLVSLLSRENHKVFWMTDHDAIAENGQFYGTLTLFDRLLRHYSPHALGKVGGAVPFEERSPLQLDLLSAADIAAGAIEHYYTASERAYPEEPEVGAQANKVLEWLAGDGIGLKRRVIMFRKKGREVETGTVKFSLKDERPDVQYIPVVVKKSSR